MTTSVESLIIEDSKEYIYAVGLMIATGIGLPVSTWIEGDPSRALLFLEAETLATLEPIVAGYIRSGFLDFAADLVTKNPEDPKARTWLRVVAEQGFGVFVPEATRATTTVLLTNNEGYLYDNIEPGRLTFRSSLTQKTYRNTTGGTLAPGPGTTLALTVVADEAGADSSAGAGEIDELVTTLVGVTCSNALAAIGTDEQAPATTVQQCRDKLDSLSPNGPKGAYAYVARNAELAGTNAVTKVRTYPDSDTGDVVVYLAGPSGGVQESDRALVEAAILEWSTPLCITPTVLSASNVTVNVTYELWIYKSVNKTVEELEEEIEAVLEDLFASDQANPIGGHIIPPSLTGALYHSRLESAIRGAFPQIFRATLSAPAGDTAVGNGQVPVLGTVNATIHIVVDPQ